jgi:cytochrome c-type biogenesis protein CcsB
MKCQFLFDLAIVMFLVSTFFYCFYLVSEKRFWLFQIGCGALIFGVSSGLGYLAARWIETSKPPFTQTFEVMVLFGVSLGIIYLILEYSYKSRILGFPSALFCLGFFVCATLFSKDVKPMVPALKNNFWLTIHVIICFVGYAAFAVSYFTSLLHLFTIKGFQKKLSMYIMSLTLVVPLTALVMYPLLENKFRIVSMKVTAMLVSGESLKSEVMLKYGIVHSALVLFSVMLTALFLYSIATFIEERFKLSEKLSARKDDFTRISYKSVLAGFMLLGIGIITGSVWAEIAWGSYWQWDPKETWSLVAWMVYLVYLHLRRARGWHGARLSWILVAGFVAVMFTFFGVNYFLSGLHSYG